MLLKVLILGGTSDARALALRLVPDPRFAPVLSFAGRTASVVDPGVPYRVGGFGGVDGLVAHLEQHGYHALVDATHAFAAQMTRHAARAAERLGLPRLRLEGPEWAEAPADRWTLVADMPEAAAALGAPPRRVFLGIGRLEVGAFSVAPQHDYLIRAVDAFEPPLPRARVISARGPFLLRDELELFERARIEVVVSKNAGTPSTYAKIEAARALGLPVIMLARPRLDAASAACDRALDVDAACAWLAALHGVSSMQRGVYNQG